MIVFDLTYNNVRYRVDACRTLVLDDGSTTTDEDWTPGDHAAALRDADTFAATQSDLNNADGDVVGDYYYSTLAEAVGAIFAHAYIPLVRIEEEILSRLMPMVTLLHCMASEEETCVDLSDGTTPAEIAQQVLDSGNLTKEMDEYILGS